MNIDNVIFNYYSYMFSHSGEPIHDFGVEHNNGWLPLLIETLGKILEIDKGKNIRIHQIKQKFAILIIYWSADGGTKKLDKLDKQVSNIIRDAEIKSVTICELCGKPGKVTGEYWITTLCEECYNETENEKKNNETNNPKN